MDPDFLSKTTDDRPEHRARNSNYSASSEKNTQAFLGGQQFSTSVKGPFVKIINLM